MGGTSLVEFKQVNDHSLHWLVQLLHAQQYDVLEPRTPNHLNFFSVLRESRQVRPHLLSHVCHDGLDTLDMNRLDQRHCFFHEFLDSIFKCAAVDSLEEVSR